MATAQELIKAIEKAQAAGDYQSAEVLTAALERSVSQEESLVSKAVGAGKELFDKALAGAAPTIRGAGPTAGAAALGGAAGSVVPGVGTAVGAAGGAGLYQLANMIGAPVVAGVNSLLGTNFSSPEEAVQTWLTQAGLPESQTGTAKAVQAISGGLAGGLGGVGAGKALQAVAEPLSTASRVGGVLSEAPKVQAAMGAGAGAGANFANENNLPELPAALAGSIAAGKAAGVRIKPLDLAKQKERRQAVKAAEAAGQDVLTSDIYPPRTFAQKTLQNVSERIPVIGTGAKRKEQQEKRVQAALGALKGQDISESNLSSISEAIASNRSGTIKEIDSKNKALLNSIDKKTKNKSVDTTKTQKSIEAIIEHLESLKLGAQVKPIIDIFEDSLSGVKKQNLSNLNIIRESIGTRLKDRNLASVPKPADRYMSRLYASIRSDMNEHIKKNSSQEELDKYLSNTNKLYGMIGELKNKRFKNALVSPEMQPEKIREILFGNDQTAVKLLAKESDNPTKRKIQNYYFGKIYSDAGTEDNFSVPKFITSVEKYKNSIAKFSTYGQMAELNGLVKALRLTQRAGDAEIMTNTGQQSFYGQLNPLEWVKSGLVMLVARPIESKAFRDFLLQLERAPAGTPQEAKAFKNALAAFKEYQKTSEKQSPDSILKE